MPATSPPAWPFCVPSLVCVLRSCQGPGFAPVMRQWIDQRGGVHHERFSLRTPGVSSPSESPQSRSAVATIDVCEKDPIHRVREQVITGQTTSTSFLRDRSLACWLMSPVANRGSCPGPGTLSRNDPGRGSASLVSLQSTPGRRASVRSGLQTTNGPLAVSSAACSWASRPRGSCTPAWVQHGVGGRMTTRSWSANRP